jgi:hypothetical protein
MPAKNVSTLPTRRSDSDHDPLEAMRPTAPAKRRNTPAKRVTLTRVILLDWPVVWANCSSAFTRLAPHVCRLICFMLLRPPNTALSSEDRAILAIAGFVCFNALFDGRARMPGPSGGCTFA